MFLVAFNAFLLVFIILIFINIIFLNFLSTFMKIILFAMLLNDVYT